LAKVTRSARDWHRNTAMDGLPEKQVSTTKQKSKQEQQTRTIKKTRKETKMTTQQLWTSLYLPNLQLESISPNQTTPIAITERIKNRQQVISCTTGATAFGITRSMTLNSAYALCPALTAIEYDEDHQNKILHQVGEWAMQFSSIVSLHPPDHLLIEIAGSKRLFEGYDPWLPTCWQQPTAASVSPDWKDYPQA